MKLIENATAEKLRGGFYTPEPIASFVLKWAINGSKNSDILEPSCGDGVFLEQIKTNRIPYKSITAVEFDPIEAVKTEKILLKNTTVLNEDFHNFCNHTEKRFDIVVGNPPYIRFQYFNEDQQREADLIFKKAKLKYSKLTNAWVSFIVGSSLLLKERGKIGFVVPAELLQVSYASQLREFLSNFYNKINIISFEKLVFPDIQQEVVLLLCEKDNSSKHFIEHIELRDADELLNLDINKLKTSTKVLDFKTNKWTYYFLDQEEINFLNDVSQKFKIPQFGDLAKAEVGITTGGNDFFTVSKLIVEQFELEEFARPMVGRSVQVNSVIFSKNDWKINSLSKAKAHLLVFPPNGALKNKMGALKYIKIGEGNGVNKGYKTGIRDDWYVVPSIRVSDALFIRRNNLYPKLILNKAQAYTTDTMHRITINKGINHNAFIASFYNSLSFAFAEISGRSYGGGVLEILPSEVENIILPYKESHENLLHEIDSLFRAGKTIDDVVSYTNNIILKKGYGFSKKQIQLADSIWKKLSHRRLNRSK